MIHSVQEFAINDTFDTLLKPSNQSSMPKLKKYKTSKLHNVGQTVKSETFYEVGTEGCVKTQKAHGFCFPE